MAVEFLHRSKKRWYFNMTFLLSVLRSWIIYGHQNDQKQRLLLCSAPESILSELLQRLTRMPPEAAIVKRNEKQGREVFSRQCISCFGQLSPQALFHCISVHDWPGKWPKSDHCDLSQETDPHLVLHVHSDAPVCKHAFSVVINPLDTLQLQPSPSSYTLW